MTSLLLISATFSPQHIPDVSPWDGGRVPAGVSLGSLPSLVPSGSLLWSRGLLSVSELSFLHFFTHEVHGHVPVHLQTWSRALSFCLSVSGPSPSPVSKLGLTLPHPHPQTDSPSEWKGQLAFLFKQITFILFYY